MNRARATRVALLGGSLVLLFLVAQLAWPALSMVFQYRDHVAWQRTGIAKYHPAFLEDQLLAAKVPLLAPRPGARDAAALLAQPLSRAAIDPAPVQEMGASWMDADPSLWAGLDFSWTAGLRDCDHWDVDRLEGTGRSWAVLAWAKLRLAKGLREGMPGPAIADVEELARLAATAERSHLVLAGLALLSYADQARDRSGLPGGGSRVDGALAKRLVRAVRGAMGYTRLHTPAAFDADLGNIAIGRCAALEDGLQTALPVRGLLRASHAAEYERLDRLLAGASDCRLAELRRRWAAPDALEVPAPPGDLDPVLAVLLRWAPGLILGEWALSNVEPTEAELFGEYAAGR